jgi:DNA replication protein DnaC
MVIVLPLVLRIKEYLKEYGDKSPDMEIVRSRHLAPARLLQDLGGHADGTWETRLRKYILADLLVLDDFGMKELSPQQAEDLYELICERYRGGSMIVVSNRAPKDWYALFPNPVFAEGSLNRLVNSAHQVFMPGKSYRPVHRPSQDSLVPIHETAASEGTRQGGESGT